jgi:hypothetical protein
LYTCSAAQLLGRYDAEAPDASLADTHAVSVHARLPSAPRTTAWRCKHLEAEFAATGQVAATVGGGGVSLCVGPFVLGRSGAQGQPLAAFTDAVQRVNAAVSDLLACFACLAARKEPPEVTCAVVGEARAFLERERAALLAGPDEAGKAAAACVRDALRNLAALAEEEGLAPPELELGAAHRAVHTSAAAVLSPAECAAAVAAAEARAASGGWTVRRHSAYPTHDLPAAALGAAGRRLARAVKARLLPELATKFELAVGRLSVKEMFVAKYSAAPGGLAALEEHEDGSAWSFVLALNEEAAYAGGGTRFVQLEGRPVHRPALGWATLFSGKNRHCGVATTAGTRYILAGFLDYASEA